MEERRKHQRVKLELLVQCRMRTPQGISFSTKVVNITPEGICFLVNDTIAADTPVELTIALGPREKVTVNGRVVWMEAPRGTEPGRAGVQVVHTPKEDIEQLIQFYCRKLFDFIMARKRILIIDDEKDMVELLSDELERRNYDVVSAYDGREGYARYLEVWPDLIILDITLPHLNGFEVCRKIRREKKDVTTPIIMLTGRTREEDKIVGGVMGAEKYITKPFDINHLFGEMDKFLGAA